MYCLDTVGDSTIVAYETVPSQTQDTALQAQETCRLGTGEDSTITAQKIPYRLNRRVDSIV
jgi:hypothetical protein